MFLRRKVVIVMSLLMVVAFIQVSATAQTITYSYDALGRLVVVSHDSDDDRLYAYDDASNRTSITVYEDGNAPNTPPVCGSWSTSVSTSTTVTSINPISGHCSDADGDSMTLASITSPSNGASAVISGNYIVFSGLPYGVTSVTFTVSDGNGGSDSAVLSVTRPFSGGGGGGGEPMCGGLPC